MSGRGEGRLTIEESNKLPSQHAVLGQKDRETVKLPNRATHYRSFFFWSFSFYLLTAKTVHSILSSSSSSSILLSFHKPPAFYPNLIFSPKTKFPSENRKKNSPQLTTTMPATDNQTSFLNRISIRRNQIPMDNNHEQELEDQELFQKHVADRFADLLLSSPSSARSIEPSSAASAGGTESPISPKDAFTPPPPPPLLSISWYRNLLDAFLCCEAEFKAVLVSGRDPSQFSKPPLDRLISDLLERAIKALDICNAVTHGLELLRHWQKLAQISVSALQQHPIGDGQVRRARKSLSTLLASMVFDDKENPNAAAHGKSAERNWSFGRIGGGGSASSKDRAAGNFRSLSWSVAKSWSAAKQIQAMAANLVMPRGAESNGLAMPVYIMSTTLVFVMWALVAAIPCQERNGLGTHFQFPRQLGWAQPIIGLQEKIGEEWKRKEKKGTSGLLEEMQRMEKVAQSLLDFADSFVFPLEEEKAAELAVQVAEMAEICQKMEEGLGPLQQQVREVFHRIVRSRAEVLDVVEQVSKLTTPAPY